MKRISIFFLLFCVVFAGYAIDVEDYYSSAEGKSGASLKTALNSIIKNHIDVGYKGLWSIYKDTDYKDGQVLDIYSTCDWTYSSDQCGNYSNICDCYNREHTIPQSWFNKQSPMVSDAFHIYPTDGKVNGIRSNYPHGETNAEPIGGKALGKLGSSSVSGYSGTVYEPDDEYKGDIARTYFYFVTCYEDRLSGFDRNDVLTGNTYPSLTPWFYNLMLKWHRNDPVSQKEIDRNEAVYKHQNNRNPFIDYPELAEHIWGNKMSEAFHFNVVGGDDPDDPKDPENPNDSVSGSLDAMFLVSDMDDFTTYDLLGTQSWLWDTGRGFAKMSGYDKTNYANEDWLISPAFNLSQYEKSTISFSHIINYANDMESEQTLWISNNYAKNTNPNSAEWIQLDIPVYPDGHSWSPAESGTINVPSEFLTDNVTFAFKYTSIASASATWEIYNFNIKATPKKLSTQIHATTPMSDYSVVTNNNSIIITHLPQSGAIVELYDLSGRILHSAEATISTHTISINTRGVYILRVNSAVTKIIVQ